MWVIHEVRVVRVVRETSTQSNIAVTVDYISHSPYFKQSMFVLPQRNVTDLSLVWLMWVSTWDWAIQKAIGVVLYGYVPRNVLLTKLGF